MPHPCVVCGRSRMNPNNRAEEYAFFGFPVNDEPRCKLWLEFCCREELYKLTKKQLLQRMICSKHFPISEFVNNFYDRLNSTAVPSIYDPKQSLYNISCVLCGRFRKDPPEPENDGATFHHFPGEEFRCLEWLDFVGVESYYRLTRKEIMFCYICSRHFDKSQFVPGFRHRLKDTAIPRIRNSDDVQSENEEDIEFVDVDLFCLYDKKDKIINHFSTAVLDGQACAACNRSRTDPKNKIRKLKFHPFPAYEIGRCLKWCQFLGREDILRMSPNQIRRLVLCSGHFKSGQNFNGPCDAIPTIHDCNDENEIINTLENSEERASVSSKKPKMDPQSKPTPLAKKRGKSKRPTLINVPKVDTKVNNFIVKKVPIPTVNNWKLIANQYQPIAVTNNVVNNISPGIKKVILPTFTGNIANLGAPIPVNSLSSMPPGLLIKINLPDQQKPVKKKSRQKKNKTQDYQFVDMSDHIKSEIVPNDNLSDLIDFQEVQKEEALQEYEDNNEVYYDEVETDVADVSEPKVKMSAKCRRTLIPIQNELRRFLNRLKPHVKRLPKKSKAKVKLAIVNMVIDKL